MNPPTPPLLREAAGVSKLGKRNVKAMSKCRSDVSKRAKRRFAWRVLRARHVETLERKAARCVEVDVEGMSKHTNFDTEAPARLAASHWLSCNRRFVARLLRPRLRRYLLTRPSLRRR